MCTLTNSFAFLLFIRWLQRDHYDHDHDHDHSDEERFAKSASCLPHFAQTQTTSTGFYDWDDWSQLSRSFWWFRSWLFGLFGLDKPAGLIESKNCTWPFHNDQAVNPVWIVSKNKSVTSECFVSRFADLKVWKVNVLAAGGGGVAGCRFGLYQEEKGADVGWALLTRQDQSHCVDVQPEHNCSIQFAHRDTEVLLSRIFGFSTHRITLWDHQGIPSSQRSPKKSWRFLR